MPGPVRAWRLWPIPIAALLRLSSWFRLWPRSISGPTKPALETFSTLYLLTRVKGTAAALDCYAEWKRAAAKDTHIDEGTLNALGYFLLQDGRTQDGLDSHSNCNLSASSQRGLSRTGTPQAGHEPVKRPKARS